MGAYKRITPTQEALMKKMRDDGYTIAQVAQSFGVSDVCVCDHTVPGFMKKRLESTKRSLEKQKAPIGVEGICEVCNVEVGDSLTYHSWGEEKGFGIWACPRCRAVANFADLMIDVKDRLDSLLEVRKYKESKLWVTSRG